MATIYANDGDTVIISRRNFRVNDNGGGDVELLPVPIMCEACNANEASDYEFGGHYVCPTCVNRGFEATVIHAALVHLLHNDDELRRVLDIMEQIDNDARNNGVYQHVDFHSASMDNAWAWDDEERNDVLARWAQSIGNVIASRSLIDRP